MIDESKPVDAAVHALSIKIAMRCYSIIRVVLPEDATPAVLRGFYKVCREQLDKPQPPPEV
jgi:hypothetical protein